MYFCVAFLSTLIVFKLSSLLTFSPSSFSFDWFTIFSAFLLVVIFFNLPSLQGVFKLLDLLKGAVYQITYRDKDVICKPSSQPL